MDWTKMADGHDRGQSLRKLELLRFPRKDFRHFSTDGPGFFLSEEFVFHAGSLVMAASASRFFQRSGAVGSADATTDGSSKRTRLPSLVLLFSPFIFNAGSMSTSLTHNIPFVCVCVCDPGRPAAPVRSVSTAVACLISTQGIWWPEAASAGRKRVWGAIRICWHVEKKQTEEEEEEEESWSERRVANVP